MQTSGEPRPKSGESETTLEFPYSPRIGLGTWILRAMFGCFLASILLTLALHPSSLGLAILVIVVTFIVIRLITHFAARDAPPAHSFYISPTHLGFGNPLHGHRTVPFHTITVYTETPSGISLIHENISVPIGLDLHRHSFSAPHWDQLSTTLLSRVRRGAPSAEITTLLDPPIEP